jgi:hypothetical protein
LTNVGGDWYLKNIIFGGFWNSIILKKIYF